MFIGQEPLSMIKIMPDIANSELSRPSMQVLPDVQGLETDARDLKAYWQIRNSGCRMNEKYKYYASAAWRTTSSFHSQQVHLLVIIKLKRTLLENSREPVKLPCVSATRYSTQKITFLNTSEMKTVRARMTGIQNSNCHSC